MIVLLIGWAGRLAGNKKAAGTRPRLTIRSLFRLVGCSSGRRNTPRAARPSGRAAVGRASWSKAG